MRIFKNKTLFQNTIKYIVILIAFGYVVTFLLQSLSRISYPYSLEGMEGAHLIEVHRILNNQQLYTSPSLEYVPLIYPPLYFYLSAIFAKMVGFGFLPLRLLSLLATIGCVALILVLVFKETQNGFSAVISSGVFLATYNLTDSWFDLARIDMVFVFFLMLGLFFIRHCKSIKGAILSGLFLSLCILTKQTAIAFILPILIYLFELPQNHHFSMYSSFTFWFKDILKPLGVAIIIGLYYFFGQPKGKISKNETFFLIIFLSFLLGSWIARSNVGGAGNTLIPAYLIISVLFGLGINRAMISIENNYTNQSTMQPYILIIILFQFVTLIYNPFSLVPTEYHKKATDQLMKEIEKTSGEVFMPSHNYLSLMAGKKPFINTFAFYELTGKYGGDVLPLGDQILMELDKALIQKEYDLIITDLSDQEFFTKNLKENYKESNYYELEKKNTLYSVYREYSNSALSFFEIKD